MRKNRLFAGALGTFALALSLASCSNEVDGPNINTGDGQTGYMSVKIITSNASTRAEGDEGENAPTTDSDFENGTPTESKIKKIRFYFFAENGNAANVKWDPIKNQRVNYLEWPETGNATVTTPDQPNGGNVETIVEAQLVISTTNEDLIPSKMIAVVNPTDEASSNNLSTLCTTIGNYSNTDGFIMTNSSYLDNGRNICNAVSVEGHIKDDADKAKTYPVDIFVERTLAKVTMDVKYPDNTPAGTIIDKNGVKLYKVGEYTIDNDATKKPVYIKLLGWNVTATTDQSYFVKQIEKWEDNLWGTGNPWNIPGYYRSYWAKTPDNVKYAFGNFFNAINDNKSFAYSTSNCEYLQENTQQGAITDTNKPYVDYSKPASKVIIAAQLVDENGNPITLVEMAGVKYTGQEALQTQVANYLKGRIYKKVTEGDGTLWKGPDPKDISFVTKNNNTDIEIGTTNDPKPDEDGRYYVKAVLDSKIEWFAKEGDQTKLETAGIDNIIKEIPSMKIWNSGRTYYYADIKHLGVPTTSGDDTTHYTGEFGVVRNHVYNFEINSITGLGTPVFDPYEKIYPEKPKNDEGHIAARVKVLAWRIVKNSTSLEW